MNTAPILLSLVLASAAAQPPGGDARLFQMDAYLQLAARAHEEGHPDRASRHVQQAWDLAAADLDGMRQLARLGLKHGMYRLVVRVHAASIDAAPEDGVLRGTYGAALVRLNRHEEALPELVAACAVDPGEPGWWIWLAEARLALYQVEETFAALDRALALDQDSVQALAVRAEAEVRNLRFDDCETTCLRILQIQPDDRRAALLLIHARRRAGRYKEALAAADAAIQRLGDRGEFRLERGRVHLESGDVRRAVTDLERAAELLPASPAPYGHLVLAYTRLELPEKAARAREAFEALEARAARRGTGGMGPDVPLSPENDGG